MGRLGWSSRGASVDGASLDRARYLFEIEEDPSSPLHVGKRSYGLLLAQPTHRGAALGVGPEGFEESLRIKQVLCLKRARFAGVGIVWSHASASAVNL